MGPRKLTNIPSYPHISLPTLKISELEEMAIREAMQISDGKVAKAAKLLGIGRATLYRRLNQPRSSAPHVDPRQLSLYGNNGQHSKD